MTYQPNDRLRFSISAVVIVFICLSTAVAERQSNESVSHAKSSEILLFLSTDYLKNFGSDSVTTDATDFTPAVDLLYSHSNGPWRFVAEFLLTDEENELERMQLSYDASEDSTILFGRFHTPTNAWISKYHHGRFLQTSISRPAIEQWEDDAGVIPAHISGAMLEQGIPLAGGNGSRIAMTFGVGPFIEDQELNPFDFLDPNDGHRGMSAGLSFAYFPDYIAETNFGLSLSHSRIVVLENPLLGIGQEFDINQSVVSLQLDWRKNQWQVLAASYYVHNDTENVDNRFGGWFVSSYVELQRSSSGRSTVYLRGEHSANTKSADYLNLFPDYVTSRLVAGFRFDFRDNQAITLELSDQDSLQDSFRQLAVQWSAVFP